MSAEDLGRSLLGEVTEERLDELLHSLRVLHEPVPSKRLGVPAIDRLLHVFEHASAPTQRAREHLELSNQWSDPISPRRSLQQTARKSVARHPIVEITSPGPGHGKTHLLYYIAAIAVLPQTWNGEKVDGKNGAAVVLDTEERFDVHRLVQVMKHYIQVHIAPLNSDSADIEALVAAALQHIHIFRPQSLDSLIATVDSLASYLFDSSAHFSSRRQITAILLDSASAFFWQDRQEQETARLLGITERSSNSSGTRTANTKSQQLLRSFRTAQHVLGGCPLVATVWNLSPSSARNPKPQLPPPWSGSSCTLRLVLERRPVAKFAANMSIEEAAKDRARRQQAVEEAGFEAWIERPGYEDWNEGFRYSITEEGFTIKRD
ncbi:hypothetical protein LTR16_002367 [Cryomyces antarcticus]|uniref:DNA recombination and repair protein Rad51-like C-terminal domain-containing protein n=1 Tax=Cryomyces antarcticus TaxID=329879 RepID=A0ABR0M7L7_9PEZI|nr:hypothetical protein LTR16_002367 [Cryomyces antarcticus]